jgi:6-phosphogluconolactonase
MRLRVAILRDISYNPNTYGEQMKAIIVAAGLFLVACVAGCGGKSSNTTGTLSSEVVYVAGPTSTNVFGFKQNPAGSLSPLSTAMFAAGSSPSAVALTTVTSSTTSTKVAYVADAVDNNIRMYTVDANGLFTATGTPVSVGTTPVAMILTGSVLLVLNQGSASISSFTIDPTVGTLTAVAGTPVATPANPASMVLARNQGFLYVITPGVSNASITGYTVSVAGVVSLISNPAFPATAGKSAAGMAVDPTGRFLYAADTANNGMVGFAIQSATGILGPGQLPGSPFAAGTAPVALAIDSNGAALFVANQGSNNITAYTIGSSSGTLNAVVGSPFAGGTGPAFVTVDVSNKFLYVGNQGSKNISAFSFTSSGTLSAVSGSPFSVGTTPAWITTIH